MSPCSGRRRWLEATSLLLLVLALPVASQSPGGGPWKTLSGDQPQVVARGGFSGLFPSSSEAAYRFAEQTSLGGVISWCDLQLTKDGVGICLPDLNMENCTTIAMSSSQGNRTYQVNGRNVTGWFPVDYTYKQLTDNFALTQGILSRTAMFDSAFAINTVDYVSSLVQGLWLNIEHDFFYKEHGLSMSDYLLSASSNLSISYVSSPEIGFLRTVGPALSKKGVKLVFRVPEAETLEPTTNSSYQSLLKNLTPIKAFASGILVPKSYIWPLSDDRLLLHQTSLLSDAHKANLEVFASAFANDFLIAYNYSYDPVYEYLSFIDNGGSSVDGLVSDFPVTASEAIACFSNLETNNTGAGTAPLIISNNGDSGNFPGCTDLAYMGAVEGGADVIDCNVQVTRDGILICLSSINLMEATTVARSPFGTRLSTFPELQSQPGIFTFNCTWEEIKSLKPEILNPLISGYGLLRNPVNKNAGNFMSLGDFLYFAKDKAIKGVLIKLENARFLVEKLGIDVVGSVIAAVDGAGYNNQTNLEVMIQSSNSSTLLPFRETKHKILYMLDELVSDVTPSALKDIATFANAVVVKKQAVFPTDAGFVTAQTKLVQTLRSAKLPVYVYGLTNEFLSIPWDFLSDPYVEIFNLVQGVSVDGIITDFPATARLYRRNTCEKANFSIPAIPPRFLLDVLNQSSLAMPPATAPYPPLLADAVAEAPLALKPSPLDTPVALNTQPRRTPTPLLCLAALLSLLLLAV